MSYNGRMMKLNEDALHELDLARAAGKITPAAEKNVRTWITAPYLAEYAPAVIRAHRHGEMAGIGGRILDDNPLRHRRPPRPALSDWYECHQRSHDWREAQGLADYVKEVVGKKPLACAIAYDTRHRSREFAELCASIMAAAGFKVWFWTAIAARPRCRSLFVSNTAIAAS